MKVLMFGWEFPPHISGGLGIACHGLTEALGNDSINVLFVVPTLKGEEQLTHGELINASKIVVRVPGESQKIETSPHSTFARTGVIPRDRKIFFKDGKSILVTKLLKDFEEILLPYRFFRIHNSHLINLSYIKKYIRGDGGQVVMQNNEVIDVSRRKKEEFLKLIS